MLIISLLWKVLEFFGTSSILCGFFFSRSFILSARRPVVSQGNHHHHHIIPFAVLTKVFVALVILTVLTVICGRIHLGALEAPVAIIIAIAKAMLVICYFMGMKYESNSNRIILGSAYLFIGIFAFFTILDIWTRIAEFSTL